MLDSDTINQAIGQPVHGSDGSKLGTVGQVYLDDTTGNPEWATVHTGLFGTKESFVPIADATLDQHGLAVPFDKSRVKDAPRVEAENGHLDVEEEAELYRYYGMTAGDDRTEPVRDEQVFDQAAVADRGQQR
ncbi:MAG: PRC-barrel domain-containing protein, partial [Lapillicoccus sp.]